MVLFVADNTHTNWDWFAGLDEVTNMEQTDPTMPQQINYGGRRNPELEKNLQTWLLMLQGEKEG